MNTTGTSAPGNDRAHGSGGPSPTRIKLAILTLTVLVACAGPPAPPPPGTVPPERRMQGTLVPWIGEPATLSVAVDPFSCPLATAPIDATGAFSLELPEALDAWLLTDLVTCPEAPVVPAGARTVSELYVQVAGLGGEDLGVVEHSNRDDPGALPEAGDVGAGRIYADRAASVHGTCVDAEGIEGFRITYALDLAQGWNFLTTTFAEVTDDALELELRSGPLPSGLVWHFLSSEGPPPPPEDLFRTVPAPVASEHAFRTLAAGERHTCGITVGGETLCWGGNDHGQLGSATGTCWTVLGELPCATTPVSVVGAPAFASVAGFLCHTCALTDTGATHCWGCGQGGELGDGRSESSLTPVLVAGDLTFTALHGDPLRAAPCALDPQGVTWCWGPGGTYWRTEASSTPAVFETELRFASLALAREHACGLTGDGSAYCWGANWYGQLGTGRAYGELPSSAEPVAVVGDHEFHDLITGSGFTCALDGLGATWCWGAIGDGEVTEPTALAGHEPFASLAGGPNHACGLTSAGAAWCWGNNWYGALGDGTQEHSGTPVAVSGGLAFEALALGIAHTCGIATDGTLYCWGSDLFGELGIGAGPANLDIGRRRVVDFTLRPSRGGAVW